MIDNKPEFAVRLPVRVIPYHVAPQFVGAGADDVVEQVEGGPAWLPDESLEAGTTLLLQLEVPLAAVVAAAARARTRGARVMLNAAPMQLLPQALVATLDVLLVNETEAAAMAGMLGAPATPDEFATAVIAFSPRPSTWISATPVGAPTRRTPARSTPPAASRASAGAAKASSPTAATSRTSPPARAAASGPGR